MCASAHDAEDVDLVVASGQVSSRAVAVLAYYVQRVTAVKRQFNHILSQTQGSALP